MKLNVENRFKNDKKKECINFVWHRPYDGRTAITKKPTTIIVDA